MKEEPQDEYIFPVYSSQTKNEGLMGYYNEYLYEDAITWTTDGANAGTVHYRDGKFYCTNVCGVLLNEDGNANRCVAEILGSVSKKYVSYVGNPKLMNNVMSEIRIHIPSVVEQKRIDELLTVIDLRITKQRELIDHLKKYKRGVSIAIFDRKISLTKNSPTWIKTTVGEICKITMGQSPDSESYNADQIGIPLVQGNADMKNRITCPQRYTSKPTKICAEGSIILSVRAPVGSVGRADRTVCLGRGVCAINSDNNDFLYYFFERNEPYWKRIEQGGTFTAISGDDIAEMPIEYPCLEERKKIADFLLKIDYRIAAEENALNQLLMLKSGLLQQLFI